MDLLFNPNRKYRIHSSDIAQITDVNDVKSIYSLRNENVVYSRLSSLIKPSTGIIDGDAVKDMIFPTDGPIFSKFDVFISHSHKDIHEAEALARYLKSKGWNPFLDHYVWCSADRLQKEIDREYCMTDDGSLYVYDKVQFSSSHVHTMLSMAILEMIAHCESFIFIESSRSINYKILKRRNIRTESPWLYQELQYVRMLSALTSSPLREERFSDSRMPLRISYGADLEDLEVLTHWSINRCFPDKTDRYLR